MTDLFNEQAFEADVLEILKGSRVGALLANRSQFNLRTWRGDIAAIQALAPAIVASIQVVKANLQAQHPGENWNRIAIETAAKILNDSIQLTGFWGVLKGFILGPIIRGILEGALATFKSLASGGDWLGLAKAILALV